MRIAIQEPIAVANFIIEIANENKKSITNLKLQKIMFFLQGYCLARYGEPIINGNFSKWKYGPVEAVVYNSLKNLGSAPIKDKIAYYIISDNSIVVDKINTDDFDDDALREIKKFIDHLLDMQVWRLVELTHEHHSWDMYKSDIYTHSADDYSLDEIRSCYEYNQKELITS